MKKKALVTVLALGIIGASLSASAFELPKVKTPTTGSSSAPSTAANPGPATDINKSTTKQNEIKKELSEWVGKPGPDALKHFRSKYGKEIRENLGNYYWEVESEQAGTCIEFSILISGPNVGKSKTLRKPCGQ